MLLFLIDGKISSGNYTIWKYIQKANLMSLHYKFKFFFILQTLKFNTGSPKKLKGIKTMMFKYIVRTYSTEKLKRRIVELKLKWHKLKIGGI